MVDEPPDRSDDLSSTAGDPESVEETLVGDDADDEGGPAADPRGREIGRYLVLSTLGAGGMGVVFAAYDPKLDRKVALKLLRLRSSDSDTARARLLREARALAKLGHPNVVSVYDVGLHDEELFVAMEFVAGQTLGEWMRAVDGPRPWREVLARFLDAGRGLAAAHEAGLVHRDVKPDNVMLSEDGEVRVMDFGLARAELDAMADEVPAGAERGAGGPVNLRLTQTGASLGTPAYMSPEQFEGRAVDARSDQFSFCVALWEALYGERPFGGSSLARLAAAVTLGELSPPPRTSEVPGWVHRALVRGLAQEPEQRWPSMHALLAALADDPARRRRKWWAVAAIVGLLGATAWGVGAAARTQAQVCAGMDRHLVGTWDERRRAEVEAALLGTKLSYAPATWTRVEALLDDYAGAWVEAREQACEATQRGEQSGALLDRRIACLDERLLHLRATVDELGEADPELAKGAVQAVLGLPTLTRCADVEALSAELPPPEDRAEAERVAALDARLVEARAKEKAGRYADAAKVADELAAEAEALAYEPLTARVALRRGSIQTKLGDYEAAVASYERAVDAALAQEMTAEAADATAALVYVVGYVLARREEGRRWASLADPLSRSADSPRLRAAYLGNLGAVAATEGELDEARSCFAAALALAEDRDDPQPIIAAQSLNNLGGVAGMEGDYASARDHYERALAIWEELLGPGHPVVADVLDNLSTMVDMLGDYEQARRHAERALKIRERALGPDHPDVARTLHALGNVAISADDPKLAADYFERAVKILEQAFGPDHIHVTESLNNLGIVTLARGDHQAALAHYLRVVNIRERELGPEHSELAPALTGQGLALLGLARPVEALTVLERALVIATASEGDASELAQTRFALARALWQVPRDKGGDRPRALELAELARSTYLEADEADEAARVEAWLRDRSVTRGEL